MHSYAHVGMNARTKHAHTFSQYTHVLPIPLYSHAVRHVPFPHNCPPPPAF